MAAEVATSKKTHEIPCEYCGATFAPQRLKFHMASKHGDEMKAKLSDVTGQLEAAKTRIKELELQTATEKPADLQEDQVAALADWLDAMTPEAWEAIGKEKGYMAEAEEPAAEVADPVTEPATEAETGETKSRKVFLAQHGIVATIKD